MVSDVDPKGYAPRQVEEYRVALAFNRGSDDRLLGVGRHANPYSPKWWAEYTGTELTDMKSLSAAWEEGWDDVDQGYATEVRGWPYLHLKAYSSRAALYALGVR